MVLTNAKIGSIKVLFLGIEHLVDLDLEEGKSIEELLVMVLLTLEEALDTTMVLIHKLIFFHLILDNLDHSMAMLLIKTRA